MRVVTSPLTEADAMSVDEVWLLPVVTSVEPVAAVVSVELTEPLALVEPVPAREPDVVLPAVPLCSVSLLAVDEVESESLAMEPLALVLPVPLSEPDVERVPLDVSLLATDESDDVRPVGERLSSLERVPELATED
jgi:hypothetical protein